MGRVSWLSAPISYLSCFVFSSTAPLLYDFSIKLSQYLLFCLLFIFACFTYLRCAENRREIWSYLGVSVLGAKGGLL